MILTSFSCNFYRRSWSLIRNPLIYTWTPAITATLEATMIGPHLILLSMKKLLSFHPRGCLTSAEPSSAAIMHKIVKNWISYTGHHPQWSFFVFEEGGKRKDQMWPHSLWRNVSHFFGKHAMHIAEYCMLPGKGTRNNTLVQVGSGVTQCKRY